MASQPMNPGTQGQQGFSVHKEALTGVAVASDPVIVAGYRSVSVGVGAVSGSGNAVQYSLSPIADVEAGTAQWFTWASGAVSANAADNLEGPVTAVRGVANTACTWFVVARP